VTDTETILTSGTVTVDHFGKLRTLTVDGDVYAQPLIVEGLSIDGTLRRVLYVATSKDQITAFDADTGSAIWQISLLGSGIAPWQNGGVDFNCTDYLSTYLGVLGTPVIALGDGTATLYLIARTNDHGTTKDTLHKINGATGEILASHVITGSVSGSGAGSSGGTLTFDPTLEVNRVSLVLSGGVVYAAWGSLCDAGNYHGWVMGFSADDLSPTMVWASTPDGAQGGVWNPGGLVADGDGKLYVTTGNGDFNADSAGKNYGMSAVKLDTDGAVLDWFTPYNWSDLSAADRDLGSGGVLLRSGQVILGSKGTGVENEAGTGVLYVLDPSNLGHLVNNDTQILQKWANGVAVFSPLAYFNGALFLNDSGAVRRYPYSGGAYATTPSHTYAGGFSRGAPWISANGDTDGILWLANNGGFHTAAGPAALYALRADDLTNLWASNQRPGDQAPGRMKWATPIVWNGRVYFGGTDAVTVYGLRP